MIIKIPETCNGHTIFLQKKFTKGKKSWKPIKKVIKYAKYGLACEGQENLTLLPHEYLMTKAKGDHDNIDKIFKTALPHP